jgi:succinyl-diaminopimelate desuccinylase
MGNVDLIALINQIDENSDELVNLHQDLIKIESVNTGYMPTGNETQVAEFCSNWLSKYEIKSKLLSRVDDRANIIAKYPYSGNKKKLMLMSHTDVVPVENYDKWEFEPFSAELKDGKILGRGSSDCKGLLASQMMAMAILAKNKIKFEENFTLVSGADEEHGGRYGFGWLLDNHPEELMFEYAINEGGGSPVTIGNNLYYLLGTGEKGRLEINIRIKGESAHASVPWMGKNAMGSTSKAIDKILNFIPDLDCSTDIFNYLGLFGIETKPAIQNLDLIINEAYEKNPSLGSLLKALSRMTITPTIIKGGIKSNSVPEFIELVLDVRTLPNQNDKDVEKELDKLFEGIPNLSYEIDYMAKPNSSPFETDLLQAIKKSQALSVGRDDIQWIPSVSNGFTDSRFTRELDVITYGFRGTHPDDNPNSENVHGTNENYGVKSLISSSKTMLGTIWEMCKPVNQ